MTAIAIFTGKDGHKLPKMYVRRYLGAKLSQYYPRIVDSRTISFVGNVSS